MCQTLKIDNQQNQLKLSFRACNTFWKWVKCITVQYGWSYVLTPNWALKTIQLVLNLKTAQQLSSDNGFPNLLSNNHLGYPSLAIIAGKYLDTLHHYIWQFPRRMIYSYSKSLSIIDDQDFQCHVTQASTIFLPYAIFPLPLSARPYWPHFPPATAVKLSSPLFIPQEMVSTSIKHRDSFQLLTNYASFNVLKRPPSKLVSRLALSETFPRKA